MTVETVEEGEQSCSAAAMKTSMYGSMPFLPPVLSANSSLLSEDLDSSVDSSGLGASADNSGQYLKLALSHTTLRQIDNPAPIMSNYNSLYYWTN